jgi:YggT family protein
MTAVLNLISEIAYIYLIILFATVILSWLIGFDVINRRNKVVHTMWDVLNRLTEPVLGPIRRLLPNLGGIDISPLVVALLLLFLRNFLATEFGACGFGPC